ncbi:hypothetical protein GCM10020295_18980 [Streptomyces cinereospinus]
MQHEAKTAVGGARPVDDRGSQPPDRRSPDRTEEAGDLKAQRLLHAVGSSRAPESAPHPRGGVRRVETGVGVPTPARGAEAQRQQLPIRGGPPGQARLVVVAAVDSPEWPARLQDQPFGTTGLHDLSYQGDAVVGHLVPRGAQGVGVVLCVGVADGQIRV